MGAVANITPVDEMILVRTSEAPAEVFPWATSPGFFLSSTSQVPKPILKPHYVALVTSNLFANANARVASTKIGSARFILHTISRGDCSFSVRWLQRAVIKARPEEKEPSQLKQCRNYRKVTNLDRISDECHDTDHDF